MPVLTRLETPHLALIPAEAEALVALIDQPASGTLGELRSFYVTGEVSPQWVAALRASSGPDPWRHGFFVVEREGDQPVVGTAGLKGAPDAEGMVEIAYGIVPSRQGRGYATEAARALLQFVAADPRVRLVRAHTLPEPNASTRVLTKCGFGYVGPVVDPDDGPVWRWELARRHIEAR
jgi:RimJ/RimL family protein N-acetyltransferase